MDSTETLNHFLMQLGTDLQLGELKLNADGVCALEASDGAMMIIELPPNGAIMHLHSPILPVPTPAPAAFFSRLLGLNRFGLETRGAAFALDESGNQVILCYSRPVEGLEYSVFVNLLGNFLETVRHWRTTLSQESIPASPEAGASNEPPPPIPPENSFFLRA